jgi:hypothetical protein
MGPPFLTPASRYTPKTMAKKSLLPGFKRLPGGAEKVQTPSGEIISDRQYKKLQRAASGLTPINSQGQKIVSNEALAKFNKSISPTEHISRPARGRTSLRKADEALRLEAIRARLELEAAKRREEKERVEEAKITRRVEAAKKKKIKARKVSAQGFTKDKRSGERRRAAQYDFRSFEELEELYEQAQGVRGIKFWGVGIRGVDERSGKHLDAWLYGLMDFSYEPDEEQLEEETEDFLMRKPYFVFTSWYVHFKKGKGL